MTCLLDADWLAALPATLQLTFFGLFSLLNFSAFIYITFKLSLRKFLLFLFKV